MSVRAFMCACVSACVHACVRAFVHPETLARNPTCIYFLQYSVSIFVILNTFIVVYKRLSLDGESFCDSSEAIF